ncbi:MAG: radical SAM protein [Sedimentisphaerales bacterium]|nr:radical SAM protein [Sedimentisphaerales bacterium]
MLVTSRPNTIEKLQLLSRDSQYDLACACSYNKSEHRTRGTNGKWIYPVTLPDGGVASLFKTLISNHCTSDCKYCPLRQNEDIRRCSLSPEEIAASFLQYYRQGVVFGLFLSSGITCSSDTAMEKLIAPVEILRKKHNFKGYVHLKILPGSSRAAIEKAISLSNAVSINIETPGAQYLDKLSSKKDFLKDIVEPMKLISQLTAQSRHRVKQTTQFIVGAAGESDRDIVNYTSALYKRINLQRVYFSAYQKHQPDNPKKQSINTENAFMREHRLYQVDFLFRKYGFDQSDIIYDQSGLLSCETDPKEVWAKNHPEFFPVSINTADRHKLLRVPGLGLQTVETILNKRKLAKIRSIDDIGKVGSRLFRACKYLDFGDSQKNKAFLFNF